MSPDRGRVILALVLFNLALQVLDGVLTYVGCAAGYAEGNPIIGCAAATLGTVPALVLFKAAACLCLALLWQLRRHPLACPALAAAAAVYMVGSAGPWSYILLFGS